MEFSQRELLRHFLNKNYENGISLPVGGYCHYLFYNNYGFKIETLTSGASWHTGGDIFPLPPKYYSTGKEIYDDIKLYFNPNK